MLTTRPRGTNDILPGEVEKWQYIESQFRRICREYGYGEIRTPVFEHTELFLRGVGDTTDIVEKEMYTFTDRGGRSITLRPENTAPAVRAYLENRLYAGPQPVKLFYAGPMFRYDRPQAGRFRQFHQLGVEVFGSHDPAVDAEVMAMAMDFYGRLGLKNLELHINSVGCPVCRPLLRRRLQDYFRPHLERLCKNCRSRFDKNPLRVLDCKEAACAEIGADAPFAIDCLCESCLEHFEKVKKYLELLNVSYTVNRRLVRGLDYYTHTAFEVTARDIGAQSSIGGGGRYNGLVEVCGGPPTPGVGYALGLERIILALRQQGIGLPGESGPEVFLATAGQAVMPEAFGLLFRLRSAGISADKDYLDRSLKAQMKYAGKIGARYAVIIGESELKQGTVLVRDMAAGEQSAVKLDGVLQYLREKITGRKQS
ncbi:MAG: histidine--tRNA ligase [Pelotomaculum sp.]|uniref:Histidine--tRNA ligase n=1 Tax=Pelotomaculum thermopropionicum (strain DSM 13744 / JCM 10971 / SI) TaxID=370438 RepID=SYH_PELTS|nr:RecName: Full=Histidine--tRNA ligase; AltName: Full=Histidyl-tRNA synthetase; Short=HisRS [Pelotomaculum thermopropionicum SI]NPV72963.1 histidine--tRNA ligase [Pelotomaculum sp.]BAF59229.1 histidyl-tRNA synthetase [Pelotomaculum thermopropionicum SI]